MIICIIRAYCQSSQQQIYELICIHVCTSSYSSYAHNTSYSLPSYELIHTAVKLYAKFNIIICYIYLSIYYTAHTSYYSSSNCSTLVVCILCIHACTTTSQYAYSSQQYSSQYAYALVLSSSRVAMQSRIYQLVVHMYVLITLQSRKSMQYYYFWKESCPSSVVHWSVCPVYPQFSVPCKPEEGGR